ncbi:MAG: Crp/Fnr family transcriptional regulator [Actinobacteria bacterium]|nr:Crp/Fnr family transcriptional regulator [Actinomycetota bacterium]
MGTDLLTPEQLDELRGLAGTRRLRRGVTLFCEGDRSDTVAYLLSGRVKVSYHTRTGVEVVLAVHGPGQLLGELSAIDGSPRSASVVALEPVDVVLVPAVTFRRFLTTHPDLTLRLLELLAERLRDADRKRVEFGSHDVVGRVAARLSELTERYGVAGDGTVDVELPLTQDELAAWVGASREGVSKALRVLRERGVIATGRRRIIVHDRDELARRGG